MEEESLERKLKKSKDVLYHQLPLQCTSNLKIQILSTLYSMPKSHTGRNEYIVRFYNTYDTGMPIYRVI